VDVLTLQAEFLVFSVLGVSHRIPDEVVKDIHDREQARPDCLQGWVGWLRQWGGCQRDYNLIANYCQVASTALLVLEQHLALPSATDQSPRQPMSKEAAGIRARKLADEMGQQFLCLSEAKQAKLIGCSWQTWSRTQFYRELYPEKAEGKTQGESAQSPRVVSLTKNVEAVRGEGGKDQVLSNLIAEQQADYEPSPLDDDPPANPATKVRVRKRL
jgi:hypothetical protein